MSVQFGRWDFDGRPTDREYLAKAEGMLAPYGPDGGGTYIKDSVGILYRAFHTTKESRSEAQPHTTPSGAVLTWDGRLDNHAELICELREIQDTRSTDVSIVAAAFERWGIGCFAKLLGDWALSIWDPKDRLLILAKDPIGTRHLYYSLDSDQVTWSTILDPLVLLAGKAFTLEEEYIAGWLSFFPATHLTPYVGTHSVPPSELVLIRDGKHTIRKYWDFDPSRMIRYRTDAEYEEHFRMVFAEAVRRRLHSDSAILAELSGGMDSSSIVCMADTVIARGAAETPRLDTISYYDDSEPNWNERPYLAKVEEKRGRIGCHIDVGSHEEALSEPKLGGFAATPASCRHVSESATRFAACLASQGNRVVLSGIGGDELTGGVPTPTAELEDLVARAEFTALAHKLKLWALNKKKPWFLLLLDATRGFLPRALVGVPKFRQSVAWLKPTFIKRHREALQGYGRRLKIFGPLPSFQESMSTLEALRRQLASAVLPSDPPYEKRYPFLDRNLMEFIYSVPREQLVRPGQRRSLMRRALLGIVPDELLNRKRKAFVVRQPIEAVSKEWASLEIGQDMVTSSLSIVDPNIFSEMLQRVRRGTEVSVAALVRTVSVEFWLRTAKVQGVLNDRGALMTQNHRSLDQRGQLPNITSAS